MSAPYPQASDRVRAHPLRDRRSLASLDEVLVDPDGAPPACDASSRAAQERCAEAILKARQGGAGVLLIYGAHLVKNGGASLLGRMARGGWVSHLATNGAGTIHDWEFAFLGRSTESVRENVATGTFGAWDETGRFIHLALMAGALRGEGYGQSLGRFIAEDGCVLPAPADLEAEVRGAPSDALAPARAELLAAMRRHGLGGGRVAASHPWKRASVLAEAFLAGVPLTAHPGIGYDIIAVHPMFNGAALGRAGGIDFRVFAKAVDSLDGGVVLCVGSAIMGPQVFEKSLSVANNLRLQAGRSVVRGHRIFVVDLQDAGGWDWSRGEPPRTNPAYYLRFCKSFARMGGAMEYACCDNVAFLHGLLKLLERA
jgi:hypothetical protein